MTRIHDTWADSDTPLAVEVYVSGAWLDITSDLSDAGVQITRRDVRDSPSQATLRLDGTDGDHDPNHPMSDLYGVAGRNTPLRVTATLDSVDYSRLYGEVSEWQTSYSEKGQAFVDITASGVTRRLARGSQPAESAYRRAHAADVPDLPGLVAYWPMEDEAGADQIASGLPGGKPMTIVAGSPTLAGDDDQFPGSGALPVLDASTKLAGPVPAYVDTDEWQVMLPVAVPSAGVGSTTRLLVVITSGAAQRWELSIQTSTGYLQLDVYDDAGSSLLSTYYAADLRGLSVRAYLSAELDGSDTDYTLSWIEVGSDSAAYTSGTIVGSAAGRANWVAVSPDGGLADVVLGHLSVGSEITSVFALRQALAGHHGEDVDDRIERLADEAGVDITITGTRPTQMGAQRAGTILDLLEQAADTDHGHLVEPRDSAGLEYRTRHDTCSQTTPALEVAWASGLLRPFAPRPDDDLTANRVTVTRDGGGSATVECSTGEMSTQAPPDGVGPYPQRKTLSLPDDGRCERQASWYVGQGTVKEPRWPRIGIDMAHPTVVGDTALAADILGVDIGDRIVITDPPSFLPPQDVDQVVTAYTETITPSRWSIVWRTRPYAPRKVLLWETAGYLLGARDSTLAVEATWSQVTFSGSQCLSLAGSSVATDLDVRVRVALDDWTPTSQQVMVAKYVNSDNERSWSLDCDTSGNIHMYLSDDGATYSNATSTAATGFTNGTTHWVRAVFKEDDGGAWSVTYYTSDDGTTWSQLGTKVTGGSTLALYESTALYQLGARSGTSVTGAMSGVITAVYVLDGVDGTQLVSSEADDWTDGYSGSGTGATVAAQTSSELTVATESERVWVHDENFVLTALGRRWTITAITGSTSPQVFTATPVDDGVTKSIPSGTAVELERPSYWSLS